MPQSITNKTMCLIKNNTFTNRLKQISRLPITIKGFKVVKVSATIKSTHNGTRLIYSNLTIVAPYQPYTYWPGDNVAPNSKQKAKGKDKINHGFHVCLTLEEVKHVNGYSLADRTYIYSLADQTYIVSVDCNLKHLIAAGKWSVSPSDSNRQAVFSQISLSKESYVYCIDTFKRNQIIKHSLKKVVFK